MKLAGDAETEHDDHVAGEDVGHAMAVHAGGQHLDQRDLMVGDLVGHHVAVGRRDGDQVGKAAIDVAPDQAAAGADMLLVVQTGVAGAAVIDRVDQHALALPGVGRIGEQLADHLVPHDDRLGRRDTAAEDLEVRPADAGTGHAHQGFTLIRRGLGNVPLLDHVGFCEHHCAHGCISLVSTVAAGS